MALVSIAIQIGATPWSRLLAQWSKSQGTNKPGRKINEKPMTTYFTIAP
jgi:hypothetical protein